jgi:D-alanyl-D-alanine carboxypeptidase
MARSDRWTRDRGFDVAVWVERAWRRVYGRLTTWRQTSQRTARSGLDSQHPRTGAWITRAALGAIAGLVIVGLVPAVGQATTPSAAPRAALQRELEKAINPRVPGAVLIARDGNHTVRLASGYAALKHRTPMRPGDRFRVGNITTSFVATVVLQLVAEGKLALDDTVESRLPGAIANGGAITLRHLLNMRSGLFDYLGDGDTTVTDLLFGKDPTHRWSPLELIAISNRHAPRFAPDTAWSYCNTCYVLLGQIIERTTGHPLGDQLRQRVFVPAGLRATSFDTEPRITGPHAHGYERLRKSRLTDVTAISPTYAWAAGAIVSTADDVARFYSKLYRGQLLRPDLLDAMQTTGPMTAELKGWGYGFGLIKKPIGCGTAFGNDAAAPGFTAYAYSSKNANRQSVLLINAGDTTMAHEDNGRLQHVLRSGYCSDQQSRR